VELSGVCIFRGLASERAAKAAEIERCERRLRRIAEYRKKLTTVEYRTGKKHLTELQEAEVECEDAITERLEALHEAMVDAEGVEYYTHPSAGEGGASSFHGGGAFPGGSAFHDEDEGEEEYSDDEFATFVGRSVWR